MALRLEIPGFYVWRPFKMSVNAIAFHMYREEQPNAKCVHSEHDVLLHHPTPCIIIALV